MYLFFELCTLKILCNDVRFLGCAKTKKILKKYESAKKAFSLSRFGAETHTSERNQKPVLVWSFKESV